MAAGTTRILDLAGFDATPIARAPSDRLIVPGFVAPAALRALADASPPVAKAGADPAGSPRFGRAFARRGVSARAESPPGARAHARHDRGVARAAGAAGNRRERIGQWR